MKALTTRATSVSPDTAAGSLSAAATTMSSGVSILLHFVVFPAAALTSLSACSMCASSTGATSGAPVDRTRSVHLVLHKKCELEPVHSFIFNQTTLAFYQVEVDRD